MSLVRITDRDQSAAVNIDQVIDLLTGLMSDQPVKINNVFSSAVRDWGGGWFHVKSNLNGAPCLGDGVTDDTVGQQNAWTAAALAYDGRVFYSPGVFNTAAPLTVTGAPITVEGCGLGTRIQPTAGFSGVAVMNLTAAHLTVIRDLLIQPPSTTTASNPACDAIRINHSNSVKLQRLEILYQNGWGINVLGDGTGSSMWTSLTDVHTYQCLKGVHILANVANGYNAGSYLVNVNVEQTTNGDGLFFEDAHDITAVNLEGWNLSSAGSGNTLHIQGACAAIYLSGFSFGGLTGSAAQPYPTVLIELNGNGTPNQIKLHNGIIESGTPGLSVTACTLLGLDHVDIFKNATHGVSIGGAVTGTMTACTFDLNGYVAGAGHYDLQATAGAGRKLKVHHCRFQTPVGSGSSQVANAIDDASNLLVVENNQFDGAPAFSANLPAVARNNRGYNPQGVAALTTTASPMTITAGPTPEVIYIDGGTVSLIVKNGLTIFTSTGKSVPLEPGESIVVTWSVSPTLTRDRK